MRPDLRPSVLAAMAAALPASAVTLNPDGLGQALIYPYYTAQSSGTDAFNTYLSVVNHSGDAKALRLRFREGRLGKSALELNLYLSPNDVWTGAVVPFSTGTRLITVDRSCTQPGFAVTVAPGEAPFIDFRNDAFSGPNDDGAGAGLDRTREGFVEILEMGKLTGAAAAAVTHNSAGVPSNCGALASITPLAEAPTGGLSGTLTLINVASGMDFTLNAEALDGLAQRPYFRVASDAYPNFNSAEIDPVSLVTANGSTYRSLWTRPVDAVSAVLMRARAMAEYTLDPATASQTDLVLTLPTRHFYVTPLGALAPFSAPSRWSQGCGGVQEQAIVTTFNREESWSQVTPPNLPLIANQAAVGSCASAGVASVLNRALVHAQKLTGPGTAVLGSITQGLPGGRIGGFDLTPSTIFQNGWVEIRPYLPTATPPTLASAPDSSRTNHSTGATNQGVHVFEGLPMLGFSARIFRNGTLRCDAGACQGNYGGAFPFKYRRNIAPAS